MMMETTKNRIDVVMKYHWWLLSLYFYSSPLPSAKLIQVTTPSRNIEVMTVKYA